MKGHHLIPGTKRKRERRVTAIHASQLDAQEKGVICGTGKRERNHKKRSTTSRISITILPSLGPECGLDPTTLNEDWTLPPTVRKETTYPAYPGCFLL
jgi:hypothetical protein